MVKVDVSVGARHFSRLFAMSESVPESHEVEDQFSPGRFSWQVEGMLGSSMPVSLSDALARVVIAVTHHKLTFLYLAEVFGQIQLTVDAKTSESWRRLDQALSDSNFSSEQVLWNHRRVLLDAESEYYHKLEYPGCGSQNATRRPSWDVEQWAVGFLEDTAGAILRDCQIAQGGLARDGMGNVNSNQEAINSILCTCTRLTHDEGRSSWQSNHLVDWKYPSRLDDAILELKRIAAGQSFASLSPNGDVVFEPTRSPEPHEFAIYRHGFGYQVNGFGESGMLKANRGAYYLYRLVCEANKPVSIFDLRSVNDERLRAEKFSKQKATTTVARQAIRLTLKELREDHEKARSMNDTASADRAEKEIVKINERMARDKGLGGKPRDLNKRNESMRIAIRQALARAFKTLLGAGLPKLSKHFKRSIFGESGCFVYRPENDIRWVRERI